MSTYTYIYICMFWLDAIYNIFLLCSSFNVPVAQRSWHRPGWVHHGPGVKYWKVQAYEFTSNMWTKLCEIGLYDLKFLYADYVHMLWISVQYDQWLCEAQRTSWRAEWSLRRNEPPWICGVSNWLFSGCSANLGNRSAGYKRPTEFLPHKSSTECQWIESYHDSFHPRPKILCTLWQSNMACWKMDHRNQWFS